MRRSRRWRWLRRLGIVAAVGVACAVAGVALVRSEFFARHARRLLIAQGSVLIGEDLHVQDLSITLRPLRLQLSGIRVHSRDPLRPGQEILAVEHLDIEGIRWGRGGVEIDRIEIREPVLRLRIGNGELRDFPGLQRRLRGRSGGGRRPLVHELVVADGDVSVSVDRPDATVRLDGIGAVFAAGTADASEVNLEIADIRLRWGDLEERLILQSGRLVQRGDHLELDGYRLTSDSGSLALDGTVMLSPKDETGAIVGTIAYDVETVADIDLDTFSADKPGLQPMAGQVTLHAEVQGVDAVPRAEGSIELQGGRYGAMELGDVEAHVVYRERVFQADELWLGIADGEVSGSAALVIDDPLGVTGSFSLRDLQLARVFEGVAMPPPWVMLTVSGDASLRGTIDGGPHLVIDVDLPCRDLRVYDSSWRAVGTHKLMTSVSSGVVAGRLEVEPDRALLRDASIDTAGSALALSVDFVYAKPLLLDLAVEPGSVLDMRDLGSIAGIPFSGRGPMTARVAGPTKDLQIDGHLALDDVEVMHRPLGRVDTDVSWHARGDLEFNGVTASRGETTFTGEGRVLFGGGTALDWTLDFDDAHLEDVATIFAEDLALSGTFDARVRLHGPWRELSGDGWLRGRTVEFLGEEFPSIEVQMTAERGKFTLSNAYLRKGRGGLYGRGTIDSSGPINLELFAYSMDLDQISWLRRTGWALTGDVAADLHIWGTFDEPLLHGVVDLTDAQYRRAGLGDSSIDVTVRQGVVRLNGTMLGRPANKLKGRIDLRQRGAYDVSFDWSSVPLHLLLPARTLARGPVRLVSDGHIHGQGHLAAPEDAPETGADHLVEIEIERLALEREEQRINNPEPIELVYDGDHLRIDRLRLTGMRTDITAGGQVGPGAAIDVFAEGTLDLGVLDVFIPDLGRCEAETAEFEVALSGRRPAADLRAEAVIRDGLIRTIHFPHALQVDDARFSVSSNRIVVERFEGSLGGGRIEGLAGSTIELLDLRPHVYDLHATCVDCVVRYPSSLPWARGTAALTFKGTVPLVALEGTVDVEEMVYRDDVNWQSSIVRPIARSRRAGSSGARDDGGPRGGRGIGLDLLIRSSGGFGISNDLGQAQAGGEIHVFGDTRHVGVEGRLDAVPGGRVWFKGQDFDLAEGSFTFPDPWAIDPVFHLVLVTTVATADQQYSIEYVIDGALSDIGGMSIIGSSDPALSEADLNALLLFGVTLDELQGYGGADVTALASQAGSIGLGYLVEQWRDAGIDQEGEGTLLPDRIEVVPDYTSTGQYTGMQLVLGKDLVPNRVTGRFSVYPHDPKNFGLQLDLRLGPNIYLTPSMYRRPYYTLGTFGDIGDFSLDARWIIEGD